MSQDQSSKGTGKVLLYIIIILALIIVGWNMYTGATVQEIGIPGLFTIKFGPKPTLPPTAVPPTAVQPTSEPTRVGEFVQQDSYSGDCKLRPQGSVCISYSDGYTWLVYDSIQGHADGGDWQGNEVAIALGFKADYYHVLGTSLVKEAAK